MVRNWQNESVVVTGGAGFIGSHLTEQLISEGATVSIADDFSRGSFQNIDHLLDETAIDVRPVDLTTRSGCARAVKGADHVFHLAASVGGVHYIERENVAGLTPSVLMNQHMLEAATDANVDQFLFASSACIYRQEHDGLNRFTEDQGIPANPFSTYGWAKVLGEVACRAYSADTDLSTGSVRIFNAYGPRESLDPESSHVLPSLCRKVINAPQGGSIELFGDGSQERGFIFVQDLVDGMLRAIDKLDGGEVINLGNGSEVVSIQDVAEMIIDISGKDLQVDHDLSKPTGTDRYCADTTKMRTVLDWRPTTPLGEGIEILFDWAERKLSPH